MATGILERRQAIRVTPTIYALSSGRPPAGIAVIRVSGPAAFAALATLTRAPPSPLRTMTLATIRDPADDSLIDRGLVVRFAASTSVTGDDLVELHVHGGIAVVGAMLRVLGALPGLVLAAPGAFTRRAFNNGRVDLAQVEGLADLVAADTESARRQALLQMDGGLSRHVDRWRATLVAAMADIEARLDFADAETDVGDGLASDPLASLIALHDEMQAVLDDAVRGERIRDGLTIVLTGRPNVGKSSLINALTRRDVAIVSPLPGTTRDVIETRLDLAGVAVTLVDTAGLRDARGAVEDEGIRRGRARAETADRVLRIGVDRDEPCDIVNKIDLAHEASGWRDGRWFVSARTGDGMAALVDGLSQWAATTVRVGEPAIITRERQKNALAAGVAELAEIDNDREIVLTAERLRRAVRALDILTGSVGVEDILDSIFAQFCIGK